VWISRVWPEKFPVRCSTHYSNSEEVDIINRFLFLFLFLFFSCQRFALCISFYDTFLIQIFLSIKEVHDTCCRRNQISHEARKPLPIHVEKREWGSLWQNWCHERFAMALQCSWREAAVEEFYGTRYWSGPFSWIIVGSVLQRGLSFLPIRNRLDNRFLDVEPRGGDMYNITCTTLHVQHYMYNITCTTLLAKLIAL